MAARHNPRHHWRTEIVLITAFPRLRSRYLTSRSSFPRAGCARFDEVGISTPQPPVTFVTTRAEFTRLHRGNHRAIRLLHMAAVCESALRGALLDLGKPQGAGVQLIDCRRKVANSRRVDERSATREPVGARCGGRMPAFLVAHEFSGGDLDVRKQGGHQRGLADAGLAPPVRSPHFPARYRARRGRRPVAPSIRGASSRRQPARQSPGRKPC